MAQNVNRKAGEEKNPLDNLTAYYEDNKKTINMVATIVLLIVVGGLGYLKLYKEPRVEKAATNMAYAQRMFQTDSLDLALNGDGQNPGFLKVKRKFGGTPSENLANYYIGAIYLKKGDYGQAVKYLKEFDGNGTMVGYLAKGLLGDAYMESGKIKEGIAAYEDAASNEDNDVLTPIYLYRAGIAYEMNNQPEKAKEKYLSIKDNYPTSQQAQDIDRLLARMGHLD